MGAIASKNWRAVEKTGVSLAKKNLCESVNSVDFLVFFSLCEQQADGCFSWIQVRRKTGKGIYPQISQIYTD